MKKMRLPLLTLLLLGTLMSSEAALWGAEGVILKELGIPGTNYCHLRFPAIREETLYWDRPVLKDPSEGDIIDFYGPCDYDPLGQGEIERQRAEVWRRLLQDSDPE